MKAYRTSLPPMPSRVAALPVDARGYPIPWFVADVDGVRDFRIADSQKRTLAIKFRLCWVCGQRIRATSLHHFVIGPMCAVTRTTSEPPMHLDCAMFSMAACPFLLLPAAKRREANMPSDTKDPAGIFLDRNPGVMCLWACFEFKRFDAGNGWLIEVGEPTSVEWFARGRAATREEVLDSIGSGFPALEELANLEGGRAPLELSYQYEKVVQNYLPRSEPC